MGGGPPNRNNGNRNDPQNRSGSVGGIGNRVPNQGPMGGGGFRGNGRFIYFSLEIRNHDEQISGGNKMGNNMNPGNMMGGGPQNQMQGAPGPMRMNRQNDRQQNRNTPYKNMQNNGNRGGGNFQRRSNDNSGQMNNNSNPGGMNRFDNNMGQMDRQPANNFDRGGFDRRGGGGFDNDNGGFGEDRRGFALPSFPNDMGQNTFGNNDRQNNGGMGNRRNNG